MKETKIQKLLRKIIFKPSIAVKDKSSPLSEANTIFQIIDNEEILLPPNSQVNLIKQNPNYGTMNKIKTLGDDSHSEEQEKLKSLILFG